MKSKKYMSVVLVFLLVLVAGCTQAPGAYPTQTPTAGPTQTQPVPGYVPTLNPTATPFFEPTQTLIPPEDKEAKLNLNPGDWAKFSVVSDTRSDQMVVTMLGMVKTYESGDYTYYAVELHIDSTMIDGCQRHGDKKYNPMTNSSSRYCPDDRYHFDLVKNLPGHDKEVFWFHDFGFHFIVEYVSPQSVLFTVIAEPNKRVTVSLLENGGGK